MNDPLGEIAKRIDEAIARKPKRAYKVLMVDDAADNLLGEAEMERALCKAFPWVFGVEVVAIPVEEYFEGSGEDDRQTDEG